MAKSPKNHRIIKFGLILLEFLTALALVLAILVLVAGRYTRSLQNLAILTFDTSSVKTQLVNQGISNPGNVQDWYEPHYLSVCKGMWQSTGTNVKDEASTVCMVMGGGYKFSLPELLAVDAGLLPFDSPVFSTWSFAVINTKAAFICLTIAIAFTSVTTITYFITIIMMPNFTIESPPLLIPRVGYLSSIPALLLFIISSAKITSIMRNVLNAQPAAEDGVAWSSGGLYALTWVATGLMIVMFTLSVALAFKIASILPSPRSAAIKEFDRKPSEYTNVY